MQNIDMSVPVGGGAIQFDDTDGAAAIAANARPADTSPIKALIGQCIGAIQKRQRRTLTNSARARNALESDREIKLLIKKYATLITDDHTDRTMAKQMRVRLFADLTALYQHVASNADNARLAARSRWRAICVALLVALAISNFGWAVVML